MNCAHVRPLLEEYFEGVIVGRRANQIAGHLQRCAACAGELRQIELVAGALATVPRAAPAGSLPGIISLRIAELPALRQRRVATGWRWVGLVAAISVVCLWVVSYLLPVLVSEELTPSVSTLGRMRELSVLVHTWFAAAPELLAALWLALGKVWWWFTLAARAAAPTIGIYLTAEIGILVAIVLVLHSRGRRMPVRQTLLI
jgi:predicted anti-sigma-YlaC factor YlaD